MPEGNGRAGKRGAAVWVLAAGMTYGAREVAPGSRAGVVWLNVCMLGHHLPQMYRDAEVHPLTAQAAPGLGLCPACQGFGTSADLPDMFYPYGPDELAARCPACEGSGRPAVHVTVVRAAGAVEGTATVLPHMWVPPVKGGLPDRCAECGGCHNESVHAPQAAGL